MSVIANFTVPSADFPLGRSFPTDSDMRITLESMVPITGTVMPYFWTASEHADTVENEIKGDGVVEHVTAIDEVGDRTLFRVEWGEVDGFVESLLETEAVVMDATGTGDEWTFQLRFPDYDVLSAFYQRCVEHDVSLELNRVHNPASPDQHTQLGLTPDQVEVLSVAMERSYFAVPRETSLVELGEILGISDSAVSQRLRRGLSALISATLLSQHAPSPPEFDD